MKKKFLRVLLVVGVNLILIFTGAGGVSASMAGSICAVDLDFEDGALPSSHGLTYVGSVGEISAFSVSGGLLHLDTTAFSPGVFEGYQLPGAYDPALDFILEFRMKVFPETGPFGVDFEVSDTVLDFEFGFTFNGIFLPPPPPSRPFFPFDPTDGFHTYRVVSSGGSSAYQIFIDGVLRTGAIVDNSGDPGNRFIFGDLTGGSVGRADIDFVRYCQFRTVPIDIKPGSFPNSVNPNSRGLIPVAILTTDSFDASTVDPTTVRFGRTGTEAAPVHFALDDVNGDGYTDMILHFDTQSTGVVCGDTAASLEGKRFSGQAIKGSDSINTVGCK